MVYYYCDLGVIIMANKKAKSPKAKKNTKKKVTQTKKGSQNKKVNTTKKVNTSSKKENNNTKIVVSKDKVKYNVAITEPDLLKKKVVAAENIVDNGNNPPKKNKVTQSISKVSITKNKKPKTKINKILYALHNAKNNITRYIKNKVKNNQVKSENNKKQRPQNLLKNNKTGKKGSSIKENAYDVNPGSKKNVFIRLIHELLSNRHILYNAALILFYIVLMIGLIRIEILTKKTIIFVGLIVLFLSMIALSYNKYLSGKIFTIILCGLMGCAIYYMQYTYDFVRNLASNVYEYKTYYVVTFDNGVNKSIYTINNKSVGLPKENCINVERKLNTKLDDLNYIEYDDINKMYEDFYNAEYRAILVNENQYKYLQNNIQGNKEVKILYEFKANDKK